MRDWRRDIAARIGSSGHPVDVDVVEELAQHATAAWNAARAEGLAADEADGRVDALIERWRAEAAALRHGSHLAAVEPPPSEPPRSPFAGLAQDVRYALRLLRRKPAYSALVLVTIALGVAATTALFSVTYGVLMKPLPWPRAERLVLLKETRGGQPARFGTFTNASFLAWRDAPQTVEALGAWGPRFLTLTESGDPERIRAIAATASLFEVLQVRPLIGTTFSAADEQSGGAVVLSETLWRRRFSSDPGIVGRSVSLDGKPHRVTGVLPRRQGYPDPDVLAWVPMVVPPTTGNMLGMFDALARVRDGVSPAQAAEEGTARARAAARSADMGMVVRAIFGVDGDVTITATPLRDALTADVRRPLFVMLASVALLFVVAVANIASLQLAHATTRGRELAIRTALGANVLRVTRQLLVEGLILSVAGGAAGVGLALLVDRALPWLLPADFPRLQHLGLDWTAVAVALAVSVAAGILFGAVPALRARRLNLVQAITEDGAAPAGAAGRTRVARGRLAIMAGQVAIACVLLVGASLLARSFGALVHADRGFDPGNVLTARVQMPAFAYPPTRRAELAEAIVTRVRALPSVTAATFSDGPPLIASSGSAFTLDGRPVQSVSRRVTPGYIAAMGMRLSGGRDFSEEDVATSRPVFIVNRTFARQYLGPNPVGQRVAVGFREGVTHWEVIGVVDDVKRADLTGAAAPEIYHYRGPDDTRTSPTSPMFIIRASGDPVALAPAFRAIVKQQDPLLAVDSVMTMEERVMATLARPRLYAVLLSAFGGLALLITAVGLFAVLSYVVAQRSRELAVRTALGATRANILGLVVRQAALVCLAGVAIGLPAAWVLSGTIRGLLFGIAAHDLVTFIVVPVVLLAATLAACLPPALRASRLDPLRALRSS